MNEVLSFSKYKHALKSYNSPSNYLALYLMDYEHDIFSRIGLIKTHTMTNDTKS